VSFIFQHLHPVDLIDKWIEKTIISSERYAKQLVFLTEVLKVSIASFLMTFGFPSKKVAVSFGKKATDLRKHRGITTFQRGTEAARTE